MFHKDSVYLFYPKTVELFCAGYIPEKETIEIEGRTYTKEDVEKALTLLKPVEK